MKGLANERHASPRARRKTVISLLGVTIILSVDHYRQLFQFPILDDLLLFLLIPLLILDLCLIIRFDFTSLKYSLLKVGFRNRLENSLKVVSKYLSIEIIVYVE